MAQGISLATKCQMLFGAAVFTIIAGALSVPWIRTATMVRENQLEVSRQLADTWFDDGISIGRSEGSAIPIRFIRVDAVVFEDEQDVFVRNAVVRFEAEPQIGELFANEPARDGIFYRYARAIRAVDAPRITDARFIDWSPRLAALSRPDDLVAVLLIDRTSEFAEAQILQNRVAILVGGVFAGVLAILVFTVILKRLIFRPVRALTSVAEKVEQGNIALRSNLQTGDDFERLSKAFDGMLARLEDGQRQLRAVNEGLDLKLGELAEANVGLFESIRLKSEFLANVSHELRTPLNSIVGFAELLEELARNDTTADPKRLRYIGNILTSGRSLLEMINELLQMAKLEAGRIDLSIGPTDVADLLEGLQAIMRPQASGKRIAIETSVEDGLPSIETDPGKLQQILYNFLSNAIKFSPVDTRVRVHAERMVRQERSVGVRIWVIDQGPGIPEDMQDTVFEKFRQVDASHTREHSGTGLGLAICKELADRLGGSVGLKSAPGRGAHFFVELPLLFRERVLESLMPV
ncbi:MAG: sensor histidine kinase [Planctomycetota bacterium]|nr:MAG: sensor histidine kinase [Planctomycetota bacterium]RLS96549.1 MAG: sensor histidine kinase [Planctomycetota bacterium]RLT00920.1 MAG: sensor histidine kinase [Planctomycetota bacterium]